MFCQEKGIQGFPVTVISQSLEQGVSMLLQTTAIGPVHPNIAIFGWPSHEESVVSFFNQLHVADSLSMSMVLISAKDIEGAFSGPKDRIDIWWRGRKNGAMMLMLAHLMAENAEWRDVDIRVIRVVEAEAGEESTHAALLELIENARINAVPEVLVSTGPFDSLLRANSSDAAVVFLGFIMPEDETCAQKWHRLYKDYTRDMPPLIFVSSAEEEDILH